MFLFFSSLAGLELIRPRTVHTLAGLSTKLYTTRRICWIWIGERVGPGSLLYLLICMYRSSTPISGQFGRVMDGQTYMYTFSFIGIDKKRRQIMHGGPKA